jgi:hypothetical protein
MIVVIQLQEATTQSSDLFLKQYLILQSIDWTFPFFGVVHFSLYRVFLEVEML